MSRNPAARWAWRWAAVCAALLALANCGGSSAPTTSQPVTNPVNQDICNCKPTYTVERQYRGAAKHVALSGRGGEKVTVAQILSWPKGSSPGHNAPRSGREHKMYDIERAYLQLAWINDGDCDIHLEISETADKNAARVIVETPIDSNFCSDRRSLKADLAAHGVTLTTQSGELGKPLRVHVVGLAFQDEDHVRGSNRVATTWEIHPAAVKVIE